MNSFAVIFLAALACANAGVLLAPSARLLQGPSASTTLIGPDGSSISSVAPGGTVITDAGSGLLAAAPAVVAGEPAVLAARSGVIAAPAGWAAPAVLARSGLVGSTVIAGPSGTVTAGQPLVGSWAAAPLVATVW